MESLYGAAHAEAVAAIHIDEADLHSIRKGTETGAVIGNHWFREEIEAMIERCVTRYSHGGDRKSARFHEEKDDH